MQSSIKYRPRTLDELIGQEKIIRLLRGQYKKKLLPQGMLFQGPKGSGKSTTAKILATSFQCKHQEKFGNPCVACRKRYSKFPIYTFECSKTSGIDDLKKFIAKAEYEIVGEGKHKVFILEEAHRLSPQAQEALLIPTEKMGTNRWIICTTRPDKIVGTLLSRFRIYTLRVLNRELIAALVRRILTKLKSELAVDDLTDALVDNGITSARLVADAVDNYVAGDSAEDAAMVEGESTIDGKALIRATIKGVWPDVAALLQKTTPGDVRLLRSAVINYLRSMLLSSESVDPRSRAIAKGIKQLAYIGHAEDSNQLAALSAELFTLCHLFSGMG